MAEQFLSMEGHKVGAEYLHRITNEPHTACVIDVNNVSARSYNEYVYKYKAPDKKLPKFMIGKENKRLREQKNSIKVDNTKIDQNQKVRSRNKEAIKIKTSIPGGTRSKAKGKCNQMAVRGISVRTGGQIDYSRRSINCDAVYDI